MSAIEILEKLGVEPNADINDFTEEERSALAKKISAFDEIKAAMIVTEPDESEPDPDEDESEANEPDNAAA